MRRLVTAIALGVAICAPAGAGAQASTPPAAATAPAPSEKTIELVRRVLAASHIERQVDTLVAAMLPLMLEQQAKNNHTLSDEDQKMILDLTRKELGEKFVPKLMELSVPIYASIYTDAELEAMADFYESPAGQSILEKTQQVAPRVAQATRELLPEATADLTREVVREFCSRTNCLQSPTSIPKARPS